MDISFVNKMEEALLRMRQEVLAGLVESTREFRTISGDMEAKDIVDAASGDIDKKMIETMGIKDANRIKLIDNAIARIKTGKYGLCLKCGKRISRERLEAIPYALQCVECQSKDDRRNR